MSGQPVPYSSKFLERVAGVIKASPEYVALMTLCICIATFGVSAMGCWALAKIYGPPETIKAAVDRVRVEEEQLQDYYNEGWSYEDRTNSDYILIRDKKVEPPTAP